MTVVGLLDAPGTHLFWFAILLVMGVIQAEMSRQIERVRRWMGGQTHINVTSVWCLAGAVLLSPGWAALLPAALYAHLWARVWRHVSTRPASRVVASAAALILSCWAAAVTLDTTGLGRLEDTSPGDPRSALVILVAALVFEAVNLALVVAMIWLYTDQRSFTDLVGTREDNALELVTLCLGGLTGLFNNSSWHHIAGRELDRARGSSGRLSIFMVDIDHFKKVNDTYGHLAGDTVLRAVAEAVNRSVRAYDSVGRFGGEEFVVALPDIAAPDVGEVAERVRLAVAKLAVPLGADIVTGLSVSIGTATHPTAGGTLDELVHAADAALLQAKRLGRNRVIHADGA